MTYIGVDPGKMGGFALIYGDGKAAAFPWDDEAFIDEVSSARAQDNCLAIVERVGAMPKQGITSTFNFGTSYGFIQGVLKALHVPYQLILPRTWKAEYGLNSDKAKSIEVCKRLFPDVSILRTPKCRVESDGMSESLLICEYGRRIHGRS